MYMDILEQCQKWHEKGQYQKIIDALEAIPVQKRTPEMDSELTRAYNNLADPHKPTCREMLKKALALLKPHEKYFQGDHYWNFRMGYSYYFLDQEGRALPYFRKALEKLPGDEDTQKLTDDCERRITLPQFTECFQERTENWWETFAEMEGSLRQMMDNDKDHTRGAELVAQMEELKAEPSMLMSQLPDALKERGLELSTEPEAYLESYLGYEMKPKQDPDADWRLDVMAGSTCCVPLINGYLNADNDFMDYIPYHFTKSMELSDGSIISGAFDPETWNAAPASAHGSTIITLLQENKNGRSCNL